MKAKFAKRRARELGLPFGGKPGKFNAITDVADVQVGYQTIIEGQGACEVGKGPIRTGVTVILPKGRQTHLGVTWAGQFNLNGNGEMTGTHWINEAGYFVGPIALTNTHSVGIVHHGLVGWMIDQYPSIYRQKHAWAMPVVAETYDGLTNDICGRHIKEHHVRKALENAKSGPVSEGNVGGGTGMITYEFKGGTGTSSRLVKIVDEVFTLGVVVQSNFGRRKDFTVLGVPVGKHWPENAVMTQLNRSETGSVIVIIATDLPLMPLQLKRMAKRAAIGIGRTGTPGGHSSGDLFLAFSTANEIKLSELMDDNIVVHDLGVINDSHFDLIYDATVQAVEEAIINAMVAAESMSTVKPAGYSVDAIDLGRLKKIMKQYHRTVPQPESRSR